MPQVATIAVIPQGCLHRYWKSLNAGAAKAEQELRASGASVKVETKAPIREDDREEQARIVESFVRRGVQGLVLAPFDSRTLVESVEAAAQAGIPTVVVDSALDTRDIVSFIATDNRKAGELAADRIGSLLGESGKVLMLRYQKGSASTEEREEGFMQRIRHAYPAIEIVSSGDYAGATRDTARVASEGLLKRHGKDAQGVFTPNESSTAGMLMALQSAGFAGKVMVVGFDASDVYIDSMRSKRLHGLVVQNPFRMGELAIRALVDHLQGKSVAKRVDTGATMVTPENLDMPAIQALLDPTAGSPPMQ